MTKITQEELVETKRQALVAQYIRGEQAIQQGRYSKKEAIHSLVGTGFSYRNIGKMLNISHQRVQQIYQEPFTRISNTRRETLEEALQDKK